MKRPSELSKTELVEIVEAFQGHLYLRVSGSDGAADIPPRTEYWNPDKTWYPALLELLAEILEEHDLAPETASPANVPGTPAP